MWEMDEIGWQTSRNQFQVRVSARISTDHGYTVLIYRQPFTRPGKIRLPEEYCILTQFRRLSNSISYSCSILPIMVPRTIFPLPRLIPCSVNQHIGRRQWTLQHHGKAIGLQSGIGQWPRRNSLYNLTLLNWVIYGSTESLRRHL